jgi:hypothetical protein
MAQYPHVVAETEIGVLRDSKHLEGVGVEAATVTAKTTFGKTPTTVQVYWEDVENSEGDMIPTLMVYIDGGPVDVMVTHIDELVYTFSADGLAQG